MNPDGFALSGTRRAWVRYFLLGAFLIAWVVFTVPMIQKWLYPDQMQRLDYMLARTSFSDCALNVVLLSASSLELVASHTGGAEASAVLDKYTLTRTPIESESEIRFSSSRLLRNGTDAKGFRATQVLVTADADEKHLLALEMRVCDRHKQVPGNPEAVEPANCEVAVRSLTCTPLLQ